MNQRGHTLLELLVTSLVLGLLSLAVMRLGPPMAGTTRALESRARTVAELRLALEYLLQDFGGTAEATETVDGELHLVRTRGLAERLGAWVSDDDAGVLYALDGDRLVRTDLALGDVVTVARGVSTFSVSESTGVETLVTLGGGEGLDAASVELVWTW